MVVRVPVIVRVVVVSVVFARHVLVSCRLVDWAAV
jgi:hypothetical protein